MNYKVNTKTSLVKEDYTRNLLASRGIKDIDNFLNPNREHINTWRDLDNIYLGVDLIDDAFRRKLKIGLVVDCDIDGFTSAAIIYQYLKNLDENIKIDYYLHEGKQHGLEDVWEEIQEHDYGLLIIPDAGTNDSEYIDKIGINTIVIDHHLLESDINNISNKMVLINNQVSGYENKDLSGAGMAYRFCEAMDYLFGYNYAENYMDLAALGICGDMMSGLEIENQYFWRKGFSTVNNFFFMTLARKQGYSITGKMNPTDEEIIQKLNPMTVAFYIVPLVNAMIRVGTMEEKERLFLAFIDGHQEVPCNKRGAKGTFEKVAIESARECGNARNHQNKIKDEVVEKLEYKIFKNDLLENEILFVRLDEDDVFPSVLNGLVAMQLSAKYKKPTIVARLNNEGYVRGSARGLNNSKLDSFKDFLNSTNLFEYTAGHDNAFGCSIQNKDLTKMHTLANDILANYNLNENSYKVDFERNVNDKDLTDIIYDIASFKDIWSQKNDEPLIAIYNIKVKRNEIQVMGRNQDTVKITKNGISYIKFFAKSLIEELNQYDDMELTIIGKAQLNEFRGVVSPQIIIEDCEIITEHSITDF